MSGSLLQRGGGVENIPSVLSGLNSAVLLGLRQKLSSFEPIFGLGGGEGAEFFNEQVG